jgi:ABC-type glutathione transport system ATPase component
VKPVEFQVNIRAGRRSIVDIDPFKVIPQSITFLFGESGIGKSLIAKALCGLLDSAELQIEINRRSYHQYLRSKFVEEVRARGFFVFQEPSSHLNPMLTLESQLGEGSLSAAGNRDEILNGLWDKNAPTSFHELLKIYPQPYRPSGGEKQRLLIAMAFRKMDGQPKDTPAFYVFDEPSGHLDDAARNLFLHELIRRFHQSKFTLLVITHDYSMISEIFKRYQDILPQINFLELARAGQKLICREFNANDYLGWLKRMRQSLLEKSTPGQTSDNTILEMIPGFKVFGRSFSLVKDNLLPIESLKIHRGEMIYVKAPSGMGKTTLAKILTGLIPAQQFSARFYKWTLDEHTRRSFWQRELWGRRLGMVFQHADEALNQNSSIRGVLKGLPLKQKLSDQFIQAKLNDLFDDGSGLDLLDMKVGLLSGGQKQRLNLLRSLIPDLDLLILDEPLNGLDFNSIRAVLSLIRTRQNSGTAFIIISHHEEIFNSVIPPDSVYRLVSV